MPGSAGGFSRLVAQTAERTTVDGPVLTLRAKRTTADSRVLIPPHRTDHGRWTWPEAVARSGQLHRMGPPPLARFENRSATWRGAGNRPGNGSDTRRSRVARTSRVPFPRPAGPDGFGNDPRDPGTGGSRTGGPLLPRPGGPEGSDQRAFVRKGLPVRRCGGVRPRPRGVVRFVRLGPHAATGRGRFVKSPREARLWPSRFSGIVSRTRSSGNTTSPGAPPPHHGHTQPSEVAPAG
jgi:hypothetical protein